MNINSAARRFLISAVFAQIADIKKVIFNEIITTLIWQMALFFALSSDWLRFHSAHELLILKTFIAIEWPRNVLIQFMKIGTVDDKNNYLNFMNEYFDMFISARGPSFIIIYRIYFH